MPELPRQSSTHLPADPNPNRKENHPHDQAQAHPDRTGADRAAVAAGAGGSELRHRPAHLGPPADSDHENYDRVRDELAVADPYATEWEPPFRHGPVADTTLGLLSPEHPGLLSQRRVDPTPPNAAPTIAVPAGRPPSRPAGHHPDHVA